MTTYSPMDIVLGINDYEINEYTFDPNKPQEYIDFLANRQAILKQRANERQTVYDKMRLDNYQNKNKKQIKQDQIGDKVLWNVSVRFSGNKKKLGPRWVGPYEIIDIFNNGQSYKIKDTITMQRRNNPMNKHAPPKRAKQINQDEEVTTEYHVPREQIKTYFKSYETQFDGIQSPIELSINALTTNINKVKINNENDNSQNYQKLFQLYKYQIKMGYIPNYDNS